MDNENGKCGRDNNPTKECKTNQGHPWVFDEPMNDKETQFLQTVDSDLSKICYL